MPDPALAGGGVYFDTPERGERLQLAAHLLRNAIEPLYLRAPAGAGKTRFCQRLFEELADEFTAIRLVGTADLDVRSAVQAQLRTAALAGERSREVSRRLLILVDDADALPVSAVETLYALQRDGACLLLCGRGERVPPAGPSGLHLIDLPPFTLPQCREFLATLDPAFAQRLGDQGMAGLCAQAEGWPGRILKRVAATGVRPERATAQAGGKRWLWAGAAVLFGLVGVVVWQQDAINAWFEPPPGPSEARPPLVDASAPRVLKLPPPAPAVRPALPAAPPVPAVAVVEAGAESAAPAAGADQPPLEDQRADLTSVEAVAATAAAVAPEAEGGAAAPLSAAPAVVEPTPAAVAAASPPPVAPPSPPTADQPVAEAAAESAVAAASEPKPSTPPAPVAAPAAVAPPAPPQQAGSTLPGASWLRAQPASHYTLQLVGARDPAALRRFVNTHGLQGDYAVVVRDLKGKPWYSLVYGSFADREQALRHKTSLDQGMAKDAWPRRFADLR